MDQQIIAASIRGLYGAAVSGLLTLLLAYQTSDSWPTAGVAGGVAALTYLAARGGVEGAIDSHRNATGNVTPADVGAFSAPLPNATGNDKAA